MKFAISVNEKRGLSRGEAAEYIGVGTSTFDAMVDDGKMPQPVRIGTRTIWDRIEVDRYFGDLAAKPTPVKTLAEADGWGVQR